MGSTRGIGTREGLFLITTTVRICCCSSRSWDTYCIDKHLIYLGADGYSALVPVGTILHNLAWPT